MSFAILPAELQLKVLSFMDDPTLTRTSQVSKHFKALASDVILDHPRINSTVHQNLLERRYVRTITPYDGPLDEKYYLHLVDGKPTLSSYLVGPSGRKTIGDTDLDSRTKINLLEYNARTTKTIHVGKTLYKLDYGHLSINGSTAYNFVDDISCLNGSIIIASNQGLFRLNPTLDYYFSKNATKISSHVYSQIVCDEKRGLIYGLTSEGIEKLDFTESEAIPEVILDPPGISDRIKKLALTLLKNIGHALSTVYSATWAVHLFGSSISLITGLTAGLGLALPGAQILISALVGLILWEIFANTVCVFGAILFGTIETALSI